MKNIKIVLSGIIPNITYLLKELYELVYEFQCNVLKNSNFPLNIYISEVPHDMAGNPARGLSDIQENQTNPGELDGEQSGTRPIDHQQPNQQLQTECDTEQQARSPEEIKTEQDTMLDTMPVNRFRNNNAIEIISLLDSNSIPGSLPESLLGSSSEPLPPTSEIERTYTYEDIEMTYTRLPEPFNVTRQTIIKRQNDIFSGNLPFNVNVRDYLSEICKFLIKTYFILEKISHI